jgi:Ca2+-binding EF-hand superfamily protein
MKKFRNLNLLPRVSKRNTTMFRLFFALLSLPALATMAAAGERTFGNGTLPEHLAMYDADESGGLSEEELQVLRDDRQQRQRRLRNRWDLDRNGVISASEREAAKAQIRKTIEDRRIQRFNEVDLNRDGQLTLAEFRNIIAVADADTASPGVARRIFDNLDGDRNDTVSTREFLLKLDTLPAPPGAPPPPPPPPPPLPTASPENPATC